MKNEELETFKIMDGVSRFIEEDACTNEFLLEDININDEDIFVDKEAIKNKTFNKLNLSKVTNTQKAKTKKLFISKRAIAIAAVFIAIVIAFTPLSSKCIAEIKKIFAYIPGYGKLVETDENEEIFTLKDKAMIKTNYGFLEINSVVINSKQKSIIITMNGKDESQPKKIYVKDNDNKLVELERGFWCSSSSDWTVNYSNGLTYTFNANGKVTPNVNYDFIYDKREDLYIYLEKNAKPICLKLEKSKSYNKYNEVGTTAIKNGYSITAAARWRGDILNINLLSPNKENESIKFEGYYPQRRHMLYLIDDHNNKIYPQKKNDFESIYEYDFKVKNKSSKYYKLVIERIWVDITSLEQMQEIELPKIGQKINLSNKIYNLKGHKIVAESIERLKKDRVSIELKVDLRRNDNMNEWLETCFPSSNACIYPMIGGFCGHISDDKLGFKCIDMSLDLSDDDYWKRYNKEFYRYYNLPRKSKDPESMTLVFNNITLSIKGPWIMQINSNTINK